MEKFLEIKNKEKELDQAKNALFDFEEGQKDASSTESADSEHSEHHQSGEEKNSSPEEELINLNHHEQIRDILKQIEPTKSNETGIEIELKLKVPEKNQTITGDQLKPGENKTLGTELVLKLNGIKQGQGETVKPSREENVVQKLNEIKQKEKEIASAKSSILTELDVKHPGNNVSLTSEVKPDGDNHPGEKGDASELVEKIKNIKDKEIELKEAKTLLFTDAGKSDQDNASGICYFWDEYYFKPLLQCCFFE